MNKFLLIAGIILSGFFFVTFAKNYSQNITSIATPAEWEPQESVWLAWPELEPIKGHSNIPQVLDIIVAITPDEYVRWINEDTVLLAEVTAQEAALAGPDSAMAITRERLEQDEKILANATNQDDKPIKIIRIPAAEEIMETLHPGDSTFDGIADMVRVDDGYQGQPVLDKQHQKSAKFISATSYLNYLVTNKVVLMPKYWKPGYPEIMKQKDQQAKAIIQSAFPNRKVMQIANMEDINIGGGGIHCITQQMPAVLH